MNVNTSLAAYADSLLTEHYDDEYIVQSSNEKPESLRPKIIEGGTGVVSGDKLAETSNYEHSQLLTQSITIDDAEKFEATDLEDFYLFTGSMDGEEFLGFTTALSDPECTDYYTRIYFDEASFEEDIEYVLEPKKKNKLS